MLPEINRLIETSFVRDESSASRTEQLSLLSHHRVVATVEESVLKMEMSDLESQEEDAPKRILFFKSMS